MAIMMKRTLVLEGHYAGKNIILAGYRFVNGEIVVTGPEKDVVGITTYLGRCYQAKWKEDPHGQRDIHTDPEQDAEHPVPGEVQPDRGGSVEEGAAHGGGDGDPEGGGTEHHSEGDGHEHAGVDNGVNLKLAFALNCLDPDNDTHWTQTGIPMLAVVAKAYGDETVGRKEIEMAIPGYNREKAIEKALAEIE